jgi:hypothetical protein
LCKRKLIEEKKWIVETKNDIIRKVTYDELIAQPRENLVMMLEQLHKVIEKKGQKEKQKKMLTNKKYKRLNKWNVKAFRVISQSFPSVQTDV